MNKRQKERLINGGMFLGLSAPWWLTAVFAVANIHDSVTIDSNGNILEGMVTRDEYRELDAISFDKMGRIEKSLNFGHATHVRFDNPTTPHISLGVAMPKSGVYAIVEKMQPSPEERASAMEWHDRACAAVRSYGLQGYEALKCGG